MEVYLPIIFFIIAFCYSIAGFGGGSSYLAVLALCGLPYLEMKSIALVCNIVVVLNTTFLFQKHKLLNLKKSLPIILFSMPLAYLGGAIQLNEYGFKVVLAGILLLAGLTMLLTPTFFIKKNENPHWYFEGIVGSSIGFFSGLVGIGGGIFLSPMLNLSVWDTAKSVAATSSLFILVNSTAGLVGLLSKNSPDLSILFLASLMLAVCLGGQLGARMGIAHFSKNRIKQVTGIIIILVATRLVMKLF